MITAVLLPLGVALFGWVVVRFASKHCTDHRSAMRAFVELQERDPVAAERVAKQFVTRGL